MQRTRLLSCAFAICVASTAVSNAQVLATYNKFVALEYKTLKQGSSAVDDQEMRRLRDEFAKTPEPSAKLLIGEVQKLNAEEMAFYEGPGKREDFSFDFYLSEHGRSGRLKGFLTLLLADLYGHVSPATKPQILIVLSDSFTPSERIFHSHPIDWAFARIGKDSVHIWLKLAKHEDERVRCHFAGTLTELKAFTGLSAPGIDCHAQPSLREQQIDRYAAWWEQSSRGATWQSVPSFFDEIANRNPTPVKRGSKRP